MNNNWYNIIESKRLIFNSMNSEYNNARLYVIILMIFFKM